MKKAQTHSRAEYTVHELNNDIIYIDDQGTGRTVTNDMENVLIDIFSSVSVEQKLSWAEICKKYLFMYRDSEGNIDGINPWYRNNRIGFSLFPLRENGIEAAATKLLKTRK